MSAAPEGFAPLLQEVAGFWSPLPDKPEETAEGVARALWLAAAGKPLSIGKAVTAELPSLDAAGRDRLGSLVRRKRAGEPLAHLTGRQEFLGLELLAGPGALIPRKETEIVGRAALAKLKDLAAETPAPLVIDVCTGSGNLALAYKHAQPKARVLAADLSQEAVDLARENSAFAGLPVDFRQGDLLAPFETEEFLGRVDLLSCNPPYISAAKVPEMHKEISAFEPSLAFNGGVYGVSILTKLLKQAPRYLRPGGRLCFEVGLGQGPAMAKQLGKLPGFTDVETWADEAGEIRALSARKI
jgi:release factor glutamine methyltransferase